MIVYVVHGNTYYEGYGHQETLFGIYTEKDAAESIKDTMIKELYELNVKIKSACIYDPSDIEVEILEIEADKFVNVELGEYIE